MPRIIQTNAFQASDNTYYTHMKDAVIHEINILLNEYDYHNLNDIALAIVNKKRDIMELLNELM